MLPVLLSFTWSSPHSCLGLGSDEIEGVDCAEGCIYHRVRAMLRWCHCVPQGSPFHTLCGPHLPLLALRPVCSGHSGLPALERQGHYIIDRPCLTLIWDVTVVVLQSLRTSQGNVVPPETRGPTGRRRPNTWPAKSPCSGPTLISSALAQGQVRQCFLAPLPQEP